MEGLEGEELLHIIDDHLNVVDAAIQQIQDHIQLCEDTVSTPRTTATPDIWNYELTEDRDRRAIDTQDESGLQEDAVIQEYVFNEDQSGSFDEPESQPDAPPLGMQEYVVTEEHDRESAPPPMWSTAHSNRSRVTSSFGSTRDPHPGQQQRPTSGTTNSLKTAI